MAEAGEGKTNVTSSGVPTSSDLVGGAAGVHPGANRRFLPVAASTQSGRNTLRFSLLPIACWKLEDLRFDIDSSFIKPEGVDEFAALLELRRQHPGSPISIFGHADPSGSDEYNKTLSGRRALAVHALLLRDVSRWEALYDEPFGGDDWGLRAVQHMVTALGFDAGAVDGKLGPKTKGAVRGFQSKKGLVADGDPGKQTRKALFADYMDFLCRDAKGKPVTLVAADFLAKGADAKLRGDVQGCSEFNPILVVSTEEQQRFADPKKKSERDAALLPDRRVMVFLFARGSVMDPARWPCPAAEDGPGQCRTQFYPNADERRASGPERRLYEKARDTMACKFYDRLARRSPCEAARPGLMLRLLNHDGEAIPFALYRVTFDSGETRRGQTGDDGWLIEQNAVPASRVLVEWGYSPSDELPQAERSKRYEYPLGPEGYRLSILFGDSAKKSEAEAKRRLNNLGYHAERSLRENLVAFQRDFEVFPADGKLSAETHEALRKASEEGMSREELIAERSGSK